MWGGGRKFSTLRKRMSLVRSSKEESDTMSKEERRMKARLRTRSKHTNSTDTHSQSTDDVSVDDGMIPRNDYRLSNATTKSFTPAFESMPSPEEVDELLEKTLESLALPVAARAKFKEKPIEEKWKVIQAHSKFRPKTNNPNDPKSAKFWIRKLSMSNSKGRPRLTPDQALNMASVFRTAHKDFITNFLEGRGVSVLNKVTIRISQRVKRQKDEAKVLLSLVECYRLLMNTELGMRGVLLVPKSVEAIAMSMDLNGGSTEITERVMLLLSVLCWYSEHGRLQVMGAMRHIKKRFLEISTFQTIVYLFQHSRDPNFQANVATFITTVCNTPPNIEQRVGVRNYFFRLDIINVFQKVLSNAPEVDIEKEAEEGPWNTINTQYEVFVAMMRQDQEEIVHKLVAATDADESHLDLANLQDAWKILQKNAFKGDCHSELLNVIQALFLVPTVHDLATPIYESIAKFIYEASTMDKVSLSPEEKFDFRTPPKLDFEELGKLLKKKLEYNAKMEVFSEKEGVVKRLRKLVGVMQKRLMDVASGEIPPEEAMDLQEDLIKNHLLNPRKRNVRRKKREVKKSATVPITLSTVPAFADNSATTGVGGDFNLSFLAGLGLMDTAGEIEIMQEREKKLKQEIDDLQKKVNILSKGGQINASKSNNVRKNNTNSKVKLDSTGLQPAGLAPGAAPKAIPPVPGAGMPGSLENAPLPWTPNQVFKPPAAAAKGKGPQKQLGVADLFAGRAKAAPKKKNLKAEKYKAALEKLGLPDKKPMKPNCKMVQVFWKVIAPDALEGTVWPELSDQGIKYDPNGLERMFGKKEEEVKMKRKGKKNKDEEDVVKLIDAQRRQNLAIALKKINLDFSKVKQAINEVDLKLITNDNIQLFIESVPTTDELVLINKFKKDGGNADNLAFEERFLFEVSQIPSLLTRLTVIKTYYSFPFDARRIQKAIVKMKKALKEVNTSKELREILQVILAIGNYMNGTSARGAAWGFKLDILANLYNVKAADGNGTLMHYLFALFEANYPQLCEFTLPASAQVVDINLKDIVRDMNMLSKRISVLKQELKKKPYKGDKLKKKFTNFEIKASRDVEKLQQFLEKVRLDFEKLALKFAEKGVEVEPCTFFPKLVSFEQDLKRAGVGIMDQREKEARVKMQKEKKEERQAYRKLKILVERTKGENGELDMGLIEAYKISQQGKANQVVDRFLAKYNRDRTKKGPPRSKNRRSVRKKGRYLDG